MSFFQVCINKKAYSIICIINKFLISQNGSSVAIGNNCGVVKHIQLLHYSRHLKKAKFIENE
jgi:hypothetical protein